MNTSDSCLAGVDITAIKLYGLNSETGDTTIYDSFGIVTEVDNARDFRPSGFSLSQNYPNPFNPTTMIKFSLLARENVILKVYDVLGREVSLLIDNRELSTGDYNVSFDGSQLPSGTYIYRLTAGEYVETKKMLLIK